MKGGNREKVEDKREGEERKGQGVGKGNRKGVRGRRGWNGKKGGGKVREVEKGKEGERKGGDEGLWSRRGE